MLVAVGNGMGWGVFLCRAEYREVFRNGWWWDEGTLVIEWSFFFFF